jgi:iron complex transport system ATP-binding protein
MRVRPPILSVHRLCIRRNKVEILREISWRVERGQHWVILGANGSGKTSLLSALTGYLPPTSGEITLLDHRFGCADWRELRKHIGIVSSAVRQMMNDEEPALDTIISGKHAMIDFWGKTSPSDRSRATRLLSKVECAHIAARPWQVLSQGERQRVLIARALMAKPKLLILDEPCAGLDPAAREHFLQFLQRLGHNKNSPTLVLVTHHVEEIMPVFSHALVLKAGSILASGTKTESLTSRVLSAAFDARVILKRISARYALQVAANPRTVI